MDDGKNGQLLPVYIGLNRPDIREVTIGDLITGLPYRFTIQAMNINGNSLQSDPETIYACDSPSDLAPPQYVSSDRILKQISLTWNVP